MLPTGELLKHRLRHKRNSKSHYNGRGNVFTIQFHSIRYSITCSAAIYYSLFNTQVGTQRKTTFIIRNHIVNRTQRNRMLGSCVAAMFQPWIPIDFLFHFLSSQPRRISTNKALFKALQANLLREIFTIKFSFPFRFSHFYVMSFLTFAVAVVILFKIAMKFNNRILYFCLQSNFISTETKDDLPKSFYAIPHRF